jgi:hypothetical protein
VPGIYADNDYPAVCEHFKRVCQAGKRGACLRCYGFVAAG